MGRQLSRWAFDGLNLGFQMIGSEIQKGLLQYLHRKIELIEMTVISKGPTTG